MKESNAAASTKVDSDVPDSEENLEKQSKELKESSSVKTSTKVKSN